MAIVRFKRRWLSEAYNSTYRCGCTSFLSPLFTFFLLVHSPRGSELDQGGATDPSSHANASAVLGHVLNPPVTSPAFYIEHVSGQASRLHVRRSLDRACGSCDARSTRSCRRTDCQRQQAGLKELQDV